MHAAAMRVRDLGGHHGELRLAVGKVLRAVDHVSRPLQTNRRGGVLLEQGGDAHIAVEDLDAAVPGLPHDGVLGNVGQGRGRRKPRPQAVAGKPLGIEPGPRSRALHDNGNGLVREPGRTDAAPSVASAARHGLLCHRFPNQRERAMASLKMDLHSARQAVTRADQAQTDGEKIAALMEAVHCLVTILEDLDKNMSRMNPRRGTALR